MFPENVITGGEENDVLIGSFGPDSIYGGEGDDFISAGESLDTVFGGSGDDVILGGGGADSLFGDAGNDVISGGAGSDTIYGDNEGGSVVTADPVTTSASTVIPSTSQGFAVSLTAPDGTDADSYTISGFVSTTAVTNPQVNISIVIDVSGSVVSNFFTGGTPVSDVNGDGISDTILDAEIAAAIAFINSVINDAELPGANIQIVEFGSGAATVFTGSADTDANSDLVLDAVQTLLGLRGDGPFAVSTNFEAPLQQAISFFNTAPSGQNLVYFLSDGFPVSSGVFTDEVATLINPAGINAKITAIGLGNSASLTALDQVDDGLANGSAQRVLDPTELNAALLGGGISPADVARVEIWLDGALIYTFLPSELVATPFGLRFDLTLAGLDPSRAEEITVIAVANDPDGTTVSTSQIVETIGAAGNDTLFGDDGSDLIYGGAGNDVIDGGDANDTLDGGDGNDIVAGGEGADLIDGGTGNDWLSGGLGADMLFGGLGRDTLTGGAGGDLLDGGAGRDIADYSDALAAVGASLLLGHGTAGDASGDGFSSIEDLWGSGFNDTLEGDGLANAIKGQAGDDLVWGGGGSDTLEGGDGNDTLSGDAGADSLVGAAGSDLLDGGTGNDSLYGYAGDDTLNGGAGRDLLSGGAGRDLAEYGSATSGVTASLANASVNTGEALGDTYTSIEDLGGSSFADFLIGNAGANMILGRAGADSISGNGGDDSLFGGVGNDTLHGGVGNDLVSGDEGNDLLDGGDGDDIIEGGLGIDTLFGGTGADLMFGGGSIDEMSGGDGNDTLYGGETADTLYGDHGFDLLYGDDGRDLIYGGEFADTIYGGSTADTLYGDGGNDFLSGDDGTDLLYGGGGADTLVGGAGNDTMDGGAGADVFFFAAGTGNGNDRILQFANLQDIIRIELGGLSVESLQVSLTGADTRIAYGQGAANTIVLVGVQLSYSDIQFDLI